MNDMRTPEKPTLDTTSHHLIIYKHPGINILRLRELLNEPCARDIALNCQGLSTFEECLAQIGADLFIRFDGVYDADYVAGKLADALLLRKQLVLMPAVGMGKC